MRAPASRREFNPSGGIRILYKFLFCFQKEFIVEANQLLYEPLFDTPDYLRKGTKKQRLVYHMLTRNSVMHHLQLFDPVLTGSVPLAIDTDESDIDISCYASHLPEFLKVASGAFGQLDGYLAHHVVSRGVPAVVVNFFLEGFRIELFGQGVPTRLQYAYRHMVIECRLLQRHGEKFRQDVINLKRNGVKTEPAFAALLGLTGDPYEALLSIPVISPG